MFWSMVLAAAKPWTYWFAPAFLVAALVLVVAIAVGYYRRVAVPAFWARVAQTEAARARQAAGATVHPLPTSAGVPERQAA
jgi:hypothetical protein